MKNNRFKSFIRKRGIALKRNFYTLPLVLVIMCTLFYLSCLFIFSTSINRISSTKMTALYLFIATLCSILSIVGFINYSMKKYGQKRPLYMLIVYWVLILITISFTIVIFVHNEEQIAIEINTQSKLDQSDPLWSTCQTYINYGVCTRTLLIIFFVFEFITNVLIILSPLIDKKLKKINFDNQIVNNGK